MCYRRAYKMTQAGYEAFLTVKSTDGACTLGKEGFFIEGSNFRTGICAADAVETYERFEFGCISEKGRCFTGRF